jgi:hypothetical protein
MSAAGPSGANSAPLGAAQRRSRSVGDQIPLAETLAGGIAALAGRDRGAARAIAGVSRLLAKWNKTTT